ncbi:MAG: hypothetical protein IJX88_03920 [Clostridia bacterium]|nr:hypothetical protein [Clostridia bacterium]
MSFKSKMKQFGRQVWELFKASIPAAIMYFCAGTILMMLTMKDVETLQWDNSKLTWTIVCAVVAAAYNGLVTYAQGGNAYEMLVSGNMKRVSASEFEGGYKISSHKYAKEYRVWKGFAIGAFIGIWTVAVGIFFGANQAKIDAQSLSSGTGVGVLIGFFISGWSVLPFYYVNYGGGAASYYLSILFALVPVIVTGVMYIVGAYAKRNKTIKAQEIADRAAAAEASKPKKINYGGLPGTKPNKKK